MSAITSAPPPATARPTKAHGFIQRSKEKGRDCVVAFGEATALDNAPLVPDAASPKSPEERTTDELGVALDSLMSAAHSKQ